jgi:hypothetical protein
MKRRLYSYRPLPLSTRQLAETSIVITFGRYLIQNGSLLAAGLLLIELQMKQRVEFSERKPRGDRDKHNRLQVSP